MRRHVDFTSTVRRGRRGSARRVVVHLEAGTPAGATTVGFVVSKAVGGAVERNLVKRRLRGLVAPRLDALPAGSRLVVRALPPAAGATSAELGQDLDRALAGAARGSR